MLRPGAEIGAIPREVLELRDMLRLSWGAPLERVRRTGDPTAAGEFVANIAKGRVVQLYKEIKDNSPNANAALVLVPLSAWGTEAQGQDFDDLAALLGDANFTEQAAGGWVRKTLDDTALAAFPAPNDTDNRYDVGLPQVTWTGPTAGNDTVALAVCFDLDTTAGTDANILPLTLHQFAVTADGNDVILNAGDFLRAS